MAVRFDATVCKSAQAGTIIYHLIVRERGVKLFSVSEIVEWSWQSNLLSLGKGSLLSAVKCNQIVALILLCYSVDGNLVGKMRA